MSELVGTAALVEKEKEKKREIRLEEWGNTDIDRPSPGSR
jgi:hypothetical protein